tara:strand:+ start:704 stop:1174 length:471 start_codon:yes stop_codon:yes gene_type:complete
MNRYLDNYNYWNDSRVVSAMTTRYWKVVQVGYASCIVEFNEFFFEELVENGIFSEEDSCRKEYSGSWGICNICSGSGKVVNPNIDAGGISDWSEWDYEEREAYFSGRYDQPCPECRGSGKVLNPNFPKDIQDLLNEWEEDDYQSHKEHLAELAYGC